LVEREGPEQVSTPSEQERNLSIGDVVEMLSSEFPDVTHSSLRFLEREGLINPQRTTGGHRLFGEDQLRRIRTIKAWQRQRLSLEEIRARLQRMDQLPPPAVLAEQLLNTLANGEREAAQQIVLNTDELGMPLATIFDEILRPLLLDYGELWSRSRLTTGQQIEIRAFARDLVVLLGSQHQYEAGRRPQTAIATCVQGEYYELALRMVTALMRADGYTVHYLGSNVEVETVVERVAARRPDIILLSATHSHTLDALRETVDALRALDGGEEQRIVIVAGRELIASERLPRELEPLIVDDSSMQAVAARIGSIVRELS
jgi:DNA-binding transcriptional MerR regulator/methylmalonyl-CoA mutase cobalamin-binding subunit